LGRGTQTVRDGEISKGNQHGYGREHRGGELKKRRKKKVVEKGKAATKKYCRQPNSKKGVRLQGRSPNRGNFWFKGKTAIFRTGTTSEGVGGEVEKSKRKKKKRSELSVKRGAATKDGRTFSKGAM